jgi:hypothetical protein
VAHSNSPGPPANTGGVTLHPAILKRYEEQLGRLEEALAKGVSAGDGEATEAIRDLVETVTVFRDPGRPGGVAVEIAGRLKALLGEKAYPNQVKGVWGKVVAGSATNPPQHHLQTFHMIRRPSSTPSMIPTGRFRDAPTGRANSVKTDPTARRFALRCRCLTCFVGALGLANSRQDMRLPGPPKHDGFWTGSHLSTCLLFAGTGQARKGIGIVAIHHSACIKADFRL